MNFLLLREVTFYHCESDCFDICEPYDSYLDCHCEERSDEAISKEIATASLTGSLAMTKGLDCHTLPSAGSHLWV